MIQTFLLALTLSLGNPARLGPAGATPDRSPPLDVARATPERAGAGLERLLESGDASAPVLVVLCSSVMGMAGDLVASLHREVESGRLKGKARFALRPIAAGDLDDASARAVIAAAGQQMLWPYVERLGGVRGLPGKGGLRRLADRSGLDGDAFDLACDHPDTERLVAAFRTQCGDAKRTQAPTAFVNGRRPAFDLTLERLVDSVEREYARTSPRPSSARAP